MSHIKPHFVEVVGIEVKILVICFVFDIKVALIPKSLERSMCWVLKMLRLYPDAAE